VVLRQTEHRRPRFENMGDSLSARRSRRGASKRGSGNGRIVDDTIADHFHDVGFDRDGIARGRCDFPGELFFARQTFD
jgi:hypothetical protein